MRELIKAKIYLVKCRLMSNKLFSMVAGFLLLLVACGFIFLRKWLVSLGIVFDFSEEKIMVIYIAGLLSLLPINVYIKIINNKNNTIYMLSGIKEKYLFIYNYIICLVSEVTIVFLGIYIFIEPLFKGVNYRWYIAAFWVLLGVSVVIMLAEGIGKKILRDRFYKTFLVVQSAIEIISFFVIRLEVDNEGNIDYIVVGIILLYIVLVMMLARIFYDKVKKKDRKMTLCKKDIAVLVRDFDSIKYLIVTIAIFMFSTVVNKNKIPFMSILIMGYIITFTVIFQICTEDFARERKYKSLYFLAEFPKNRYINGKTQYAIEVTFCCVGIYSLFFLLSQGVSMADVLIYILSVGLLIVVESRIMTKYIYGYMFEKLNSIKKVLICGLKTIMLIIKLIIINLLGWYITGKLYIG